MKFTTMIAMFGDRISSAVFIDDKNRKSLRMAVMCDIIKEENNADIKEAYKHYFGYMLAPYIMINDPQIILYDGYELKDLKILKSKYKLAE